MSKTNGTIKGASNAAKYLKISRMTVHRLIDKGEFPQPVKIRPGLKVVREWRRQDLDDFGKTLYARHSYARPRTGQDCPAEVKPKARTVTLPVPVTQMPVFWSLVISVLVTDWPVGIPRVSQPEAPKIITIIPKHIPNNFFHFIYTTSTN